MGNIKQGKKRINQISKSAVKLAVLGFLINSLSVVADDIEATPDFGTQVQKNQNVFDVTTSKIKDRNAFNSFEKFNLNKENIANLHFGSKGGSEADKLFNFVNGRVEVDGTVNAIRNNAIGGDLYFLSSDGMVIGKTGVVNAGSFQAITPTKSEFEKALSSAKNGDVSVGLIPEKGKIKIALNPNGTISVNGKINATNEIGVYSPTIKIGETGFLKTGVVDFTNLVNVGNSKAEMKNIKLKVEKDLEKGDIILSAHTSREKNNITDNDGSVGSFVKTQIKAHIENAGHIEAEKNVKISAVATNGDYKETKDGKDYYKSRYSLADVSATVDVQKGKIKGKNVEIKAEAKNHQDTPELTGYGKKTITLGKKDGPSAKINGSLGILSSKAEIKIGKEATIISSEGKADINAFSSTRALIEPPKASDKLSLKKKEDNKKEKAPVVSAAYLNTKSSSKVIIEGNIESEGAVSISSKSVNNLNATVNSGSEKTENNKIGAAVLITKGENDSFVEVKKGSKIRAKDNVDIKSETNNSVKAHVSSQTGDDGKAVIAANITQYKSSSKIKIDGDVKSDKKLNVDSKNITQKNDLKTKNFLGTGKTEEKKKTEDSEDSKEVKEITDAIKEQFGENEKAKEKLSNLFGAGAAVTIAKHDNSSRVEIGSGAELSSGKEGVSINSLNKTENISVETSSVANSTEGEKHKKASLNAAAFYGNIKNNSSVEVDEEAKVSSEGKINVSSANKIEYTKASEMTKGLIEKLETLKNKITKPGETLENIPKSLKDMKNLLEEFSKQLLGKPELLLNGDKISIKLPDGSVKEGNVQEIAAYIKGRVENLRDELKAKYKDILKTLSPGLDELKKELKGFTEIGNYANFYTYTSGAKNSEQGTSSALGTVSWLDMENKSKVTIGRKAKLSAKDDLDINSENKAETANIVGKSQLSKTGSDTTAVGGSLNVQRVDNFSKVETKEKAELLGKNINLNSNSNIFHVTATVNGGKGGNVFNGMVNYSAGTSKNIVSVDDETILKAEEKINLKAKNNTSVTNVAGALGINEKNVGVGVAVAINEYKVENKAAIEDNDEKNSKFEKNKDEVTVSAQEVNVNAETTGTINSVALAGGISKGGDSKSEGKPGFLDGIENKIEDLKASAKYRIKEALGLVDEKVKESTKKDAPFKTEENTNTGASHSADSLPKFSFNGAGSVAVNSITSKTSSSINGANIQLKGGTRNLNVTSKDSSFNGAWSGAAAIQWNKLGAQNSHTNVGLSGAAGVNSIQRENLASIKNSKIKAAKNVRVHALNGGTQVATGLALGVAKDGGEKGKNFQGGLSTSLNFVKNNLRAELENNVISGDEENKTNVDVVAYDRDTQITGAANAQAGKSNGSVGAAVTVARLRNYVTAVIKGGEFNNVNEVNSKALLATKQITAAGSVGVVKGTSSGVGTFQGAVAVNDIQNNVNSSINGAKIKNAGKVNVLARDVRSNSEIVKGLERELAGNHEEYLNKKGVKTNSNDYSSEEQAKQIKDKDGAVIVSAALSGGASNNAAGVGVAVNKIKNQFNAQIKNQADISSKEVNVAAKSSTVMVNAGVGAAIAKNNFAGMGSIASQDLENEIIAKVEDSNIKTDKLNVTTQNAILGINIAGAVAGSNSTAVGAVLANNFIKNKTGAYIKNSKIKSLTSEGVKLVVNSQNTSDISTVAVGAAVSTKGVGVGGTVAVNRGTNSTEALVEDSEIENTNSTEVLATNSTTLRTISGNITGGKGVGVGGTVAYSRIGDSATLAGVKKSKITTISEDKNVKINVDARDNSSLTTVAGGIGGAGSVAVHGAAATAVINKKVHSFMEKTDINKESKKEIANLRVYAENKSKVTTNATSIAGAVKGAAVEAGVAVNKIEQDTYANVNGGTYNLKNALIKSIANPEITTIGIGAGVGAGVGVAGSVAVNRIVNNNTASILGSKIIAKGNVGVIAQSDEVISNYAGQAAASAAAGVGLSTAVNKVEGTTKAFVADSTVEAKEETQDKIETNSEVTGVVEKAFSDSSINDSLLKRRIFSQKTGVVVDSSATHTIKSLVANVGAGGKVGVAGTVNVNEITGDTIAEVQNSIFKAKNSWVRSADYTNSIGHVGTAAGGLSAGVGASSDTNLVKRNTKTIIGNKTQLFVKEHADITADSKQGISSFGVGVGAAGVGAGVAGTVSVTKLEGKTNVQIEDSKILGAKTTKVAATHYGSVSVGNGAVGAAVKGAGIGAGVSVIKDLNQTGVKIKNSIIETKDNLDVKAENETKLNVGIVSAGVAGIGAGVSGSVSVNNITNKVGIEVDNSTLHSSEGRVNVNSNNKINASMTTGGGAGGLAAVTGVVSVNTVNSSVTTKIKNNSRVISGKKDVNITAKEERNIKQVAANAGIGGVAAGANILINNFGTAVEDKNALSIINSINTEQEKKIDEKTSGVLEKVGILSEGYTEKADSNNYAVKADTGKVESEGIKVEIQNSDVLGKNINIKTEEKDLINSVSGGATGGLVAASGTVAITNIKRDIGVSVNNSNLLTDGVLDINSLVTGNVDLKAYQGSIGAGALGAAYAELNAKGNSKIRITNSKLQGRKINIIAKDDSQLNATSKGLTGGVIAAGAIVSKVNNESTNEIEVNSRGFNEGTDIGEEINIKVEKANKVMADSTGGSVGVASGVGVVAKAKDSGKSVINIKRHPENIFNADKINVEAVNKLQVSANTSASGTGLLSGVGVSQAEAIASGTAFLEIEEGSKFRANKINFGARVESLKEGKATAKANTISASGGGVGSGDVNTARAESNTDVIVRVRRQDYQSKDSKKDRLEELNLFGINKTKNEADIQSLAVGGVYSQGQNKAILKSDKTTSVTGNGGKVNKLSIKSFATSESKGNAKGSGGALVGTGSGAIENILKNNTGLALEGQWDIRNKVEGSALDKTIVNINGQGVKGGLVGKNGIVIKNTVSGETKAIVGKNAKISGTGSISLEAKNDLDVDVQSKNGAYGGVGVGNVDVENNISKNTEIKISENSKVELAGNHEYQAFTKGKVNVIGDVDSAGGVGASNAKVKNNMKVLNLVRQYFNSLIATKNPKKDITLASSSELDLKVKGVTNSKGFGATSTSDVDSDLHRGNNIVLAGKVISKGKLNLFAGADKTGKLSSMNVEVESGAKSSAVIASANYKIRNRVVVSNSTTQRKAKGGKVLSSIDGAQVNFKNSIGQNKVTTKQASKTWYSSQGGIIEKEYNDKDSK